MKSATGLIATTLGFLLTPIYLIALTISLCCRFLVHIALLATEPGYFGMLNILELFFDREVDGAISNINSVSQLTLTDFTNGKEVRRELVRAFTGAIKETKKMSCVIREKAGFRYWQAVDTDVDKQIRLFQPKSMKEVREFLADIAAAPISNDRLWEVIVAENPIDGRCPCIFRIHHSLADGYAIREFLLCVERISKGAIKVENGGKSTKSAVKPMSVSETSIRLFHELLNVVELFLFAPTICIYEYFRKDEDHSLRTSKPALKKQLGWQKTDFDKVKKIHEITGRSCTTVLLTALSKALDDIFKKRGETVQHARVVFPFRRSQHSHGMTNEFIPVGVQLPVSTRERELDVLEAYVKFEDEPTYKINYFIPRYAFLLFPWHLPKFAYTSTQSTTVFSNYPGPGHKMTFKGFNCDEILFFVPNFHDNNALGITISSYNDQCVIAAILDKSVVRTENDAQDLVDSMAKYIEETHASLT